MRRMYLHTHAYAFQHTLPQDSHQHLLTPFPTTQGALRILLKQPLPIYQYCKRGETCFLSLILSALQIRSSEEVPKLQRSELVTVQVRKNRSCAFWSIPQCLSGMFITHTLTHTLPCLLCVLII